MKYFGYICSYLILIPLSITFSGYTLSVLWDWFIVTTFAMESIPTTSAIGLSLIMHYTTYQYSENKTNDNTPQSERLGKAVFMAIIRPSFVLLTGWVVTLFM